MGRYKFGKPRKRSRFICLKCIRYDGTSCDGIQRINKTRNNNHIKDMWCCHCKGEVKTLEVREHDFLVEKIEVAKKLHNKYYGGYKV